MPADFLFRQITNERGYGYSTFSHNNTHQIKTADEAASQMLDDLFFGKKNED